MQRRHLLLIAICTVLLVVLLTAGWEFLLEEFFDQAGEADGASEFAAVKFEFVM